MILITGATGFVGSGLIGEFSKRRIAMRAVSRSPRPGFHAIGEIGGKTDWSASLAGITTVVHLAARVHVMTEKAANPLAAFRSANVEATVNLARQSAQAGVKRFIFLSSVKVNGEATAPGHPFSADDIPHPEDPYGISKYEAEQALLALGRETGMDITIIRPPLIYGPGVKANFARLMGLVRRGIPLPFGSIDNSRSLVFLGNLTDFISHCIHDRRAAGEIFLVSDGEDVSTAGLIRRMAETMNVTPRLLSLPPGLLDTAAKLTGKRAAAQRLLGSLQVDIMKSRELLDWSPPYTLSQGLRLTVGSQASLRADP